MARLSRLLLGGAIGAGLAYLFSRKEVRRRLLGGGRKQLTSGYEQEAGMPAAAYEPMPAASEAAETVDLEAKIEETKRQIAEQLEEPFTPPADFMETTPVEEAVIVEDVAVEEAAAEEAAAAESAEAAEAAAEAVVQEPVVEEVEVWERTVRETPAKEVAIDEASAEEAPVVESTIEETIVEEDETAPPVSEPDEFAALSTPVQGEPTVESEPSAVEEITTAAPGPAPSEIDREEMRRRIDETRARLKAKAFDAMVSGETFIAPEPEEGSSTKKPDAGVEIDEDVEQKIDQSLKEET